MVGSVSAAWRRRHAAAGADGMRPTYVREGVGGLVGDDGEDTRAAIERGDQWRAGAGGAPRLWCTGGDGDEREVLDKKLKPLT